MQKLGWLVSVHRRWMIGHLFRGGILLFGLSLAHLLAQAIAAGSALSGEKVYDSLVVSELLRSVFVSDALLFVSSLFAIHLLLASLVLVCWRFLAPARVSESVRNYYLLLLLGGAVLFLANRCVFPQSYFSGGTDASWLLWALLWVGLSGWLVLLLGGRGLKLLVLPLLLVGGLVLGEGGEDGVRLVGRDRPDIILIGFDSLRPDAISESHTPALSAFLRKARVHEEAITPMARTYPSWMSILSGVNPVRHGARFNLIPDQFIDSSYPLMPEYLAAEGFQTLFAMDERRFADISEQHGFSRVIGPRAGISEFLMGVASDIPLLNFFRRLPVAQMLFPHVFANRAAYFSYWGDEYVESVADAVSELDEGRPALIAAHFCKGHWPYSFVGGEAISSGLFDGVSERQREQPFYLRYLQALKEADEQFAELMLQLRAAGRLDNALVFVLSDHGESFQADALDLSSADGSGRPYRLQVTGHGTHASIPAQFRVLLSYQEFRGGEPVVSGSFASGRVSLVDVMPTVLDYLGLKARRELDGRSLLLPYSEERDFFVESGFSVPAMLHSQPDAKSAFQQGLGFYRVHENGKVELKAEKIPMLLRLKEYSHIGTDDLLVYGGYSSGKLGFRYLDLQARTWVVVDSASEPNLQARARKICRHFAEDPRLRREPLCQGSTIAN